MFRWPFFTVLFDSHDLQSVEAGSDTLEHDRTVHTPHDMAIRLKLPFPAAVNHKDEPARLPAHDTLHRVKRA